MKSAVNLEIEIIHHKNLPLSAQEIAAYVAQELAGLGDIDPAKSYTFGRRSMVGTEDGDNVSVFLRSAFVESQR